MRILFLDLDGTVRYSKHPSGFINNPEDVAVYPEAAREMKRFHDAGWEIAFISNQGGIASGFTTAKDFHNGVAATIFQITGMVGAIPVTTTFCPHDPDGGCFCRKPRPGMVAAKIARSFDIKEIASDGNEVLGFDIRTFLFVGDRHEDEGCAKACGIPFMSAKDWRAGKGSPG